jgi:hypothetical protein
MNLGATLQGNHGGRNTMNRLSWAKVLGLVLTALAWVPAVPAAGWPEKPIRIIIPWPPGGSTDVIGRVLAADLTTRFKQQVIIDNRAGAGSIVGLQIATAAPPDGYILHDDLHGVRLSHRQAEGACRSRQFVLARRDDRIR